MPKMMRKVEIVFDESQITHYGGLYLFHKFCKKLNLNYTLQHYLKLEKTNRKHQPTEYILILIYIIIAGIGRIENVQSLGYNGVVKRILGIDTFPNPTSIRRFLYTLSTKNIRQIVNAHTAIQRKIFTRIHPKTSIHLDIDGTVLTAYGKQQSTKIGFNPKRRGARSYLALLCFESDREFWYGSLKPGNASQIKGAPDAIRKCIAKLPYPLYRIRLRADSGFYGHKFIENFLETENIVYAIDALIRKRMIPLMENTHYQPYMYDWETAEFMYQPDGWKKAHRFIVQRRLIPEDPDEKAQLKLFEIKKYGYRVLVTNLTMKQRHVWNFYNKRALGAELNIKELKMNYPLSKIPTNKYTANVAYFHILLFAFNIMNWFKWLCLPKEYEYASLGTVREKLIKIPARLIKKGNRNVLKFPAGYPHKDLLNYAVEKIAKMENV